MRFRILFMLSLACAITIGQRAFDVTNHYVAEIASWIEVAETARAQEAADEVEEVDEEEITEENATEEPADYSTERPVIDDRRFTDVEVEILQNLAQRRKSLEAWEEEIKEKERVLNISSARIEDKITELRTLKNAVEKRLTEFSTFQGDKTRQLVKIYESMKPKDAARIFSEMEMDILLQVVRVMKEKNAAPIIAKMDAERARELTERFAAQGNLE